MWIIIRKAACTNTTMAKLTRQHNDANILALGARIVGDVLALDIVDEFTLIIRYKFIVI